MAGDGDPFFLQIKEARPSVLEPYAGASVFSNNGERMVNGYRLMQPASDMFLGWTPEWRERDFFIRQLSDVKISAQVETFGASEMASLRPLVWTCPGPLPRTLRVCCHAQRIHGQERRVRRSHRHVLDGIRRSERERSRRARPRGSQRESEGGIRAGGVR